MVVISMHHLQLLPINRHLDHLVNALVWGDIKAVLFRHARAQKPRPPSAFRINHTGARGAAYRPPKKCLPLKCFTSGFGAVKLMSAPGIKPFPGPSLGGPLSMSQLEGASTARMGTLVSRRASMTLGKGSRTSPEKLKPKMASTTRSEAPSAASKSLVKGTERSSSCLRRRAYSSFLDCLGE